jgi:hypothetical protein
MKRLCVLTASCLVVSCASDHDPVLPVASGTYQFDHRDAEFPTQRGFPVSVTVDGSRYRLAVRKPGGSTAMCELDAGTLMWNRQLQVWILGHRESDRTASAAGGCQDDGPDTIDFKERVIWTCVGESILTDACAHPQGQ